MHSSRSAALAVALAATAVLGLGGFANAQASNHLSDNGYISASRCAGLAEGSHVDVTALKAVLAHEQNGRESYTLDRADEARADARDRAERATGYDKQSIANELAGRCQTYLKG